MLAATAAAALAALALAGGAASEPAAISAKRAEAQQVLAQIRQIDSELDQVVDAYNRANERLGALEERLRETSRRLEIARSATRAAERNLEERVVALYQNGEQSILEVVFGSASLDDVLDRIDAAKRVSSQDKRLLRAVVAARAGYRVELQKLTAARAEQRKVVAERAAKRQEIESKLAERQRLYGSIRSEIERMQAAEQRRQARLAAEAERRLSEADASGGAAITIASPTTTAVPASRYGGVVGIALQYLGVPYRWGGASPSGFDCSGFVMYVFAQVGVSLPHSSYAQYGYGVPVSRDQLQPGDLVFFDGLGHEGIYIGGGQFVHAPHTGDVVKISSIDDSWYAATWVGARRIL